FCPIAGMAIGEHIMTLQGHPEFTKAYARDLLGVRRELLGERLYQQGVDSLDEEVHQDRVALVITDFLAEAAADTAA
ncbi:MAG: GMP synthase, partial [Gammaproteobacteria bacterium]